MAITLHTILEEFRQEKASNRDLGDKFERLMVSYFKTDPIYIDQIAYPVDSGL